jgi:hypothetical protein
MGAIKLKSPFNRLLEENPAINFRQPHGFGALHTICARQKLSKSWAKSGIIERTRSTYADLAVDFDSQTQRRTTTLMLPMLPLPSKARKEIV